MRLEGVAIHTTEDVLRSTREEVKSTTKRPRGRPRKLPIGKIISEEGYRESDSSLDSACSPPATRRRMQRDRVVRSEFCGTKQWLGQSRGHNSNT